MGLCELLECTSSLHRDEQEGVGGPLEVFALVWSYKKALRGESRLVEIEQETLLSKYRRNRSATYTTVVRQCNKKTIDCKDNKAYELAGLNNSKK